MTRYTPVHEVDARRGPAHARRSHRAAKSIRIDLTDDYRRLIAQVEEMPRNQNGADKSYDHANQEFVTWYRSEPRPHSTARSCFASRCRSLSPELAAGIRRFKGVRRVGVRLGLGIEPDAT